MKINPELIKLLLIAILCNALIIAGFILLKISAMFTNGWLETASGGIGAVILWNVISYVSQHELKRKIIKIKENLVLFKITLEEERTWWRSML